MLVKSRALELLVEGYLSGCTASDAAPLAALLAVAAHPAAPAGLPGALAAAVVGLGELAALDPLSGAAQARQSAGAAVALLKSGVAAPAERGGRGGAASQLGGLAAKLEALEAQLPKTTSLKEQVRLWGDIFSTTQQKLDVVRGAGSARAPPEVAAALGPLDGLHGALEGRMKVGGARVWTALCRRMHACMLAREHLHGGCMHAYMCCLGCVFEGVQQDGAGCRAGGARQQLLHGLVVRCMARMRVDAVWWQAACLQTIWPPLPFRRRCSAPRRAQPSSRSWRGRMPPTSRRKQPCRHGCSGEREPF